MRLETCTPIAVQRNHCRAAVDHIESTCHSAALRTWLRWLAPGGRVQPTFPRHQRGRAGHRVANRYPCCLELTGFGPIAIGPACICCCALRRWNRQAASCFPSSRHRSACPSHLQLFAGLALARWRYISSIARQSARSLMGFSLIPRVACLLAKTRKKKAAVLTFRVISR